jgi:hypothetical protein
MPYVTPYLTYFSTKATEQELQRILTRALDLMYSDTDSPSGLSQNCNYLLAIKTAENQLKGLREEWYLYIENYCGTLISPLGF